MSLDSELTERMKAAMRARDGRTVDLIRMIRTRVKERETAAGFEGTIDDPLVLEVIAAYVKQMTKAIGEYERAGAAGQEAIEQLRFEIAYLEPFLPSRLDEAATRQLVAEAIAAEGIADPRQAGRVVGVVMRTHRDVVDAQTVRRLAQEILGG